MTQLQGNEKPFEYEKSEIKKQLLLVLLLLLDIDVRLVLPKPVYRVFVIRKCFNYSFSLTCSVLGEFQKDEV